MVRWLGIATVLSCWSSTLWATSDAQWTRLWDYSGSSDRQQPAKRAAHGLVSYQDSLYVYGGIGDTVDEEDHEYDDTWRFDILSRTWLKVIADGQTKPSHRFHHAAVLHSNATAHEMVMFGGLSIEAIPAATAHPPNHIKITQFNDIWRLTLSPNAEKWTKDPLASSPPIARSEAGVVVHDGQLYVFGGISYEQNDDIAPVNYNDLWRYDLSKQEWAQLIPKGGLTPPARFSHTMGVFTDDEGETFLLVFSGRQLVASTWTLLGDAWVFSLTKQEWSAVSLSARMQRAYTSMVMTNTNDMPHMWFFGGYYKPQQSTNGYVYDDIVNGHLAIKKQIDGDVQTAKMTLFHASSWPDYEAPPLRYNHRAALWRDTMLLHGGSYQTQRGDVWMYNLTASVMTEELSSKIPVDIATLVYVLGGLLFAIILLLIGLLVRWRRIDRRNMELARQRGVAVMRGVAKDRLDQMEVTKYRKPSKEDAGEAASPTSAPQGDGEDLQNNEDVCPICLIEFEEDEDVRNLPCKHIFHVACIDEWLKRNTTCPMCKNNLDVEVVELDTPVESTRRPSAAVAVGDEPRGGAIVTPMS
ncbi:hypothetical protein Poli38472_008591 [Pythium oligandrum]|uniref:RING-type domain-containing protein n=1 Tax=Pythium oligandrum TaxID=41045 RepID=A0A8K1C411_PYTOL|nr:hypothetical protein Poli38472_008591 [Pythium oligandrum]|eukprot:TMW55943.1 hypothetical protein Poli38472_008591 [Pythium oligandrum]